MSAPAEKNLPSPVMTIPLIFWLFNEASIASAISLIAVLENEFEAVLPVIFMIATDSLIVVSIAIQSSQVNIHILDPSIELHCFCRLFDTNSTALPTGEGCLREGDWIFID